MHEEDIKRLLDDLEEYKTEYDIQTMAMKVKGINYSYDETGKLVNDIYTRIKTLLTKLLEETPLYEKLKEDNRIYLKRIKVIRICLLLFRLGLFNAVMFILGKNNSTSDKCLGVLCGIIGWKAGNMVSDDLESRFVEPYRDDEQLEQYFSVDEKRYSDKEQAKLEIKTIANLNKSIREDLIQRERVRKRKAKEREKSVINELKG